MNIVAVDDDTIAVVSFRKRFCIKGAGMATAVMDILEYFNEPKSFDDVIPLLSKKYSAATITKLLNYMVDVMILVDEKEAVLIKNCDRGFMDKAFFYTTGGKGFQEIIDNVTPLHIGIIGTHQQVCSLLNELSKGQLLSHFHVAVTDYEAEIGIANDNIYITHYSLQSDFISAIIKASDMVISASNYHDHYMFNKINAACFAERKKWLRVVVDGIHGEVGPLFIPHETCCYSCLYTRWRRNMAKEEYVFNDLFATQSFHEGSKSKAAVFSALYPLHAITTGVAVAEVFKHFAGMPSHLKNQVLSINAQNFETETHYIFKDYQCPVCAHGLGVG